MGRTIKCKIKGCIKSQFISYELKAGSSLATNFSQRKKWIFHVEDWPQTAKITGLLARKKSKRGPTNGQTPRFLKITIMKI
jgi:hypothetical protein